MIAHAFLLLFQGAEAPPVVVTPTRPPGGDDAPRSHVGIRPKLVKDRKRAKHVEADELEALYDRILGIAPQTKAEEKAVAAAVKAVERHAEVSEPEPAEVDWVSLQADLNAVLALREAYERLIEDEDEDALIAILLAA